MSVRVAQVGSTQSGADRFRLDLVVQWLLANHRDLVDPMWINDLINLRDGRDFLTEESTYDIVILHHLFWAKARNNTGMFAISPNQCPEAWRQRLIKSDAKVVFAFGDWTEVSVENIKDVVGYSSKVESFGFGVYQRIPASKIVEETSCKM